MGAAETKGRKKAPAAAPKPVMSAGIATGRGTGRISAKKREEDEKRTGSSSGAGGSANLTVGNLRDFGTREVGQLFFAGEGQSDSGSAEVLLDCGASSHMFCDRSFFTDCKPISGHETVAVGDSRHVPIMGRGTVSFKSKLLGGYRTVILKEVLYVPQLAANLVSLGTLQRNGATFESIDNGVRVMLKDDELFRASFVGVRGTFVPHRSCAN